MLSLVAMSAVVFYICENPSGEAEDSLRQREGYSFSQKTKKTRTIINIILFLAPSCIGLRISCPPPPISQNLRIAYGLNI